ncbi:alkene reductase [Terrihabitans soli]|uniref:Alkene reductase n=1 Tax=Terrihabitans soli TaxID=708113 RepID=A0A6S6QKI0_9HYPH|nr:alkene reductase [Terrihabitans soli]BCJ89399.1 alkene reductase [Terrihabitans soli]
MSDKIFTPIKIGAIEAKNRIAMAPLTRSRAVDGDVPNPLAITYYKQRAQAGLIVSEGTQIRPDGKGYVTTPGIYSPAQIAGWKKVTDAVHEAGGKIVAQIWHVGRISHPDHTGGTQPVAPSAVAANAKTFISSGEFVPVAAPRALTLDEIKQVVADYGTAAKNAIAAGFDGVELHGANGYLIDQFLRDGANKRTDQYGGSIENRVRFMTEAVDAAIAAIGADRVGIRLSPVTPANDLSDSNPQPLFDLAVSELSKRKIAFLHMVEGATGGPRDIVPDFDFQKLKKLFGGVYIANNGFDGEMAKKAIDSGEADMVAFGKWFISNPDLVERIKTNAPLAAPDKDTFYGGGAKGYTDYPALSA